MTLPKGFKITLGSRRTRYCQTDLLHASMHGADLWVVESHTYPVPAPEGQGRDRILIFEDTNGDGTLDKPESLCGGTKPGKWY
jgi:hypothetical protein